jgi:hypothetical protein
MLANLRRQAAWSVSNYHYADDHQITVPPPTEFILRPSGILDPFSIENCGGIRCRFIAAEQFARTLGLIADRVVLPDVLTPVFLNHDSLDDDDGFVLLRAIVVLGRLKPLIEAGIVSFGGDLEHPRLPEQHALALDTAVDGVLHEIVDELHFSPEPGGVKLSSGALLGDSLNWHYKWSDEPGSTTTTELGLRGFRRFIRHNIEMTLRDMASAATLRALLASGSRLGLLGVQRLDASPIRARELQGWEAMRSLRIPWVADLSVEDVVRLRAEAAEALPRLRALITKEISTPGNAGEQRLQGLVADLQAEAAEIEAELHALKWRKERGFRTLTGTLGITIAVYGTASGFMAPAVALGSLMSLLGLIHSADRGDQREHERLQSRPGYALLTAQHLLKHDHDAA